MLEKYISQLLHAHDFVVIPGFGGFIGRHKSAEIHPITHKFLPPSKSIAFNEKLNVNDGLLITTLCRQEQVSAEKAGLMIREYINVIFEGLKKNNRFVINEIGKLFYNPEKKLEFEPEIKLNYLEESFGLADLFFKPIERNYKNMSQEPPLPKKNQPGKKVEKTAAGQVQRDADGNVTYDTNKKSYKGALILLPVILLLVGLSTMMYMHKSGRSFGSIFPFGNQPEEKEVITSSDTTSTLSSTPDSLEGMQSLENTEEAPLKIENTEAKVDENADEVMVLTKQERHYVVVGSFSDKENALKLKRKLTSSGRRAKIIKVPEENLYRVAVVDFYDRSTAVINMEILKAYYGDTIWVLSY